MYKQYDNVLIRKANEKDIDDCMKIIKEKAKWLRDKGINQWTSFFERDNSYLIEKVEKEILYVGTIDNEICVTFILKEDNKYWENDNKAVYIGHLAVKEGYKGLGKYIIEQIKIMTKKQYIRLDHVAENEKLSKYYDLLGFAIKKEVYDDNYHCILREMYITNEKTN